jgi:hypothetical protein
MPAIARTLLGFQAELCAPCIAAYVREKSTAFWSRPFDQRRHTGNIMRLYFWQSIQYRVMLKFCFVILNVTVLYGQWQQLGIVRANRLEPGCGIA